MDRDNRQLFESYVDGVTQTKKALGGHIMSIVKYGIPSKKEFIKIRQELHDKAKEIEARGTPPSEEEREWAHEIIAKIKNYRSQNPNDPPALNPDENAEGPVKISHVSADEIKNKPQSGPVKIDWNSEEDEDMSKSPFHYDPMHGLASAANKIRDELRSAANDEARTEHIEKMAEIILGPQSEYASYNEYNRILSGVIELLNHYVVVPMN